MARNTDGQIIAILAGANSRIFTKADQALAAGVESALRIRIAQLETAIRWALGEDVEALEEFGVRPGGALAWRPYLREIADLESPVPEDRQLAKILEEIRACAGRASSEILG